MNHFYSDYERLAGEIEALRTSIEHLRRTMGSLYARIASPATRALPLIDDRITTESLELITKRARSYNQAIGAQLALIARETANQYKAMAGTIDETFKHLKRSLSDGIFDALRGELKSLGDYLDSFVKSFQRTVANMLSEMAVNKLVSYIGGSMGGGGGVIKKHHGGFIKFHYGGLAHDEVPAVLQRGEYVVSRKGVEALDRINSGQVSAQGAGVPQVHINVENRTGREVRAREGSTRFDGKRYVKSVVLELMNTDPGFRSALGGNNG